MRQKIFFYFLSLLYCCSILYVGFFVERTNFTFLFGAYSVAFIIYWFLFQKNSFKIDEKKWLYVGILLRLALCFAFPRLSDDIYRFFWDGKLLVSGYNPFDYLPSYFIENQIFTSDFDKSIFERLNSPNYFSIYPPICQIVFSAAYWLSPQNLYGASVIMKLFLFACEVGTIWFLYHKKETLQIGKNAALLYALNPLCIIEICGNLHFEGAMIFFFLVFLFFNTKIKGSLFYAFSICSKLLTLMFLPIFVINFLKDKNWKKMFSLPLSVLVLVALFFLPLIDATFVANFSQSLNLYFQKFEFNASLYYVGKIIGTWIKGYNPMQYVSFILSCVVLLNIIVQSFRHINLFHKLFWVFFVYLMCQTIVHPWYLTTLVLLSVLADKPIGILWSGLVFLSYSHYDGGFYKENYTLIFLEYNILILFYVYKTYFYHRKNLQ